MELIIDYIGGMCPVQAEGTIDGTPFYFRARGAKWEIGIGLDAVSACLDRGEAGGWYKREPYGENFKAGYMPVKETIAFIEQCAKEYLSEGDNGN